MSNISLCIPTMDRYDTFLHKYLLSYVKYLEMGLIDEIVICDENGNDYEKLCNSYNEYIHSNTNFKVYKNDEVLGVFKNKLKVCSLANSKYIALIDSDNFCDDKYFLTVKQYIQENENSFSSSVVLAPSFAKPNFNYSDFDNSVVTKYNLKDYFDRYLFDVVLNTGNFVISKNIIEKIQYEEQYIPYTSACDVLFFILLAFMQIDDFQLRVVKGLEYDHVVHNGSVYINNINNCINFRDNIVMENYRRFMNNF